MLEQRQLFGKKKSHNIEKVLRCENRIDSHARQIKVGDDSTALSIGSDIVSVHGKFSAYGDSEVNSLKIYEKIQIPATDGSDSQYNEIFADVNGVHFNTNSLLINSEFSNNTSATLGLIPESGTDSKILFYEGASVKWGIGHDASDTDNFPFVFGTSTVLGTSVKMSLNQSGDLSLVGDLAVNGDDVTTDGNMNLDSGGSLTLDAHDGNFIAKKAGTEFSATNSAYAGMILGYTRLTSTAGSISFEIQNSMTVESDLHKITFKTPPSELVEIEMSALINVVSTSTHIETSLSTQNATDGYSALSQEYEYDGIGVFHSDGEADDEVINIKWVLDSADLADVGSENTFWVAFSTNGETKTAYLQYGGRAAVGQGNHPFIIKATALPVTIYDGT